MWQLHQRCNPPAGINIFVVPWSQNMFGTMVSNYVWYRGLKLFWYHGLKFENRGSQKHWYQHCLRIGNLLKHCGRTNPHSRLKPKLVQIGLVKGTPKVPIWNPRIWHERGQHLGLSGWGWVGALKWWGAWLGSGWWWLLSGGKAMKVARLRGQINW